MNRISTLLAGAAAISLVLSQGVQAQSAFVAGGHGVENGGNGMIDGNGVVLSDFTENARLGVLGDLVVQAPGFTDLLHNIARIWPLLASDLYASLYTDHFYLTEESLQDLPQSTTGLLVDDQNVQIAVKDGKDVLISMPAFRRTSDVAYLLIHEALHDLIPGDGLIHDEKVRETVRALRQMMSPGGALTEDGLMNLARSYDIQVHEPSAPEALDAGQKAVINAESAVLQEQGSIQARCVISSYILARGIDYSKELSPYHWLVEYFQQAYGATSGFCSTWVFPLQPLIAVFPAFDLFIKASEERKPGTAEMLTVLRQQLRQNYSDPAVSALAGLFLARGMLQRTWSTDGPPLEPGEIDALVQLFWSLDQSAL